MGQVKIYGLKLVNGLNVELPDATPNWNLIPVQGIGTVQQAEDAILVECISNDPILLIDLDYQTLSTVLSASDASEIANRRWQGVIIFAVTMFLFSVLGHWFFPILVASFVWIIAFLESIHLILSPRSNKRSVVFTTNWHPRYHSHHSERIFRTGNSGKRGRLDTMHIGNAGSTLANGGDPHVVRTDRHYLAKSSFGVFVCKYWPSFFS